MEDGLTAIAGNCSFQITLQDVVLEPISTGDIIDRAIRLYRKNFGTVVLIVAIANIVSFTGNLLVTYGSVSNIGNQSFPSIPSILAWIFGYFLVGFVHPFVFLMMFAGLVRAIADHIMLGTDVTLTGTFKLIKARVGQLLLGGLLILVLTAVAFFALYIALIFIGFLLALVFTVAVQALPPWLYGTLIVIIVIALAVGAAILMLVAASRIIFIPHAIMIEGLNACSAVGRSFSLGKNNWYRLLGIILFYYFVTGSIAMALLTPIAIIVYLAGLVDIGNAVDVIKWFSIAWAFIAEVSSILTTPILAITLNSSLF